MDEQDIQQDDQSQDLNTSDLEQQLRQAQEEARTNLSGWQRAQADFENYKKRKDNESKELVEFAREVTVAKLLPTLDSLEQALRHMPEGIDQVWKDGILKTLDQLDKALAEMGVKKIEAVGKKFDPNFHEAVREVPGDEDHMVMEEYQTGYELNGKVIRPSQVAISKKQ